MSDKNNILKNQKKILYILVAGVVCIAIIIGYFFHDSNTTEKRAEPKKVDLPSDDLSLQENWNSRTQDKLSVLDKKFGFFENVILDSKEKEDEFRKENRELRNEIELLKDEISKKKTAIEIEIDNEPKDAPYNPFSITQEFDDVVPIVRKGLITQEVEFSNNMVKNVDKTIPSGTTVKAVMVSSVDAPCGAYSSTDPQPVKLQILDDGHLPKNVRARLKGGIVIASAYGDLSSERIYLRVERLTQIKPSGNFVETVITGFVTGEDGKYGVRGSVVDRSAKLVENAAYSGFLSGVNGFFQAYAASRWSPYGYGCGPCYGDGGSCDYNSRDLALGMAAQGGAEGVNNAFDTLTDYFIRRAELIKPVIQVNAGRIVDITFSLGTEIGDLHARKNVETIRNESRRQNAS